MEQKAWLILSSRVRILDSSVYVFVYAKFYQPDIFWDKASFSNDD